MLMRSILKTSCAALALAAFATGCDNPDGASTSDVPATSPATSPTAGTVSSGAPSSEMRPVVRDAAAPDAGNPAATPTPKTEPAQADAPKTEAPKAEEPKLEVPKAEPAKAEEPKADAPKTAAVKLDEAQLAEIKKLPAGEVDAAIKQAVCPVSEEHLGSMGTPIKVSAEGKTFYVCCKGCTKEVETNPKDVVAKLAK